MKVMVWATGTAAAAVLAGAGAMALKAAAAEGAPPPATRPASAPANPIETLRAGEWYEVPDSPMRKVAFQWPPGTTPTLNGIGIPGIMMCWSGGAYDTKRDRLIIWGGGHAAYSGNEIYVFDVNTLKWERVNDPTLNVDPQNKWPELGVYEDGTPRSSHTYNYIQYVPAMDRFVTLGTWATFSSGNHQTGITFTFDFDSRKWERKSKGIAYSMGTFTAVDPVTGHLFARGNINAPHFAEWDPLTDKWTNRGEISNRTCYGKTAAIDAIARRFFAVGEGSIYKFDFSRPGNSRQEAIKTEGPQDVVNANTRGGRNKREDCTPGLDYDPVLDRIVGWVGGAEVYTLDLETLTWEQVPAAATNTVTPAGPAERGTYGRFRYVPSKNVYVVVSSVDQNVFFYRLSDRDARPIPKRFVEAVNSDDAALVRWVAREVARWKGEKSRPVLRAALEHHRKAGDAEIVQSLERLVGAAE